MCASDNLFLIVATLMNPTKSKVKGQDPISAALDESFEHLYQYLLDATEQLLEKCLERNIIGSNAMRALCFLVISFRTCYLDEPRAATCLDLMGVAPDALDNAFSVLAEIRHVAFPPKLVDRIALLHRLLPDVPQFPRDLSHR